MSQQNGLLNDTVLKIFKLAGLKKVEHVNPIIMMSLSKMFLAIRENGEVVKIWFHLIEDVVSDLR
jgi:hypothetical protein